MERVGCAQKPEVDMTTNTYYEYVIQETHFGQWIGSHMLVC